MELQMEMREVTYLAIALRIIVAVIVGGLLGLERGLKNRPAGLRTYMLVCVGSCLVMLTNQYMVQAYSTGDPVRMGAQVVSGIGFLGAGTIIVTRRNQIKGLTTAAGLWASAGIGLALGVGFYEAALIGGFAVFFVMTLMQRMDHSMHRRTKILEVYIELDNNLSLGDFLREIRSRDIEVVETQRDLDSEPENSVRSYVSTLKLQKRQHHAEVVDEIHAIPGVVYVEEL